MPRLCRVESGQPGGLEVSGAEIGGLDHARDVIRHIRRQPEAAMDRPEQPFFDGLVGISNHNLERRDHVADDVFRRVMQQEREPPCTVQPRCLGPRHRFHQQRMLRDRENIFALGLAVPARDPRQPMRDILDLDIERGGIKQIEPASRQHALPGARRAFLRNFGSGSGMFFLRHGVYFASFAQASWRWHVTR